MNDDHEEETGEIEDPEVRIVEGGVDRRRPHFIVSYGDVDDPEQPDVARLAAAAPDLAVVEFVLPDSHPEAVALRDAVMREIRYFLIEKEESGPWQYLMYHCTTGANLFRRVHFGYWPEGEPDSE